MNKTTEEKILKYLDQNTPITLISQLTGQPTKLIEAIDKQHNKKDSHATA